MHRMPSAGGLAHHPGVWDMWGLGSGAWGSAYGAQHALHASFSVHAALVHGVQHAVPASDVTHGTRCTARGSPWMMHTGLDTRGPCHSGGSVQPTAPNHPPSTQTSPWRAPLHLTPLPSHPGLCHGQHNLPGGIWGGAPKQAPPWFFQARSHAGCSGVPTALQVMPGGCRASPHPTHTSSVWHWLRRGARQGQGTQGTLPAGWPGRAEPGRKPLQEGSSGLTNKSLTASPEAGGRKQAPWLYTTPSAPCVPLFLLSTHHLPQIAPFPSIFTHLVNS